MNRGVADGRFLGEEHTDTVRPVAALRVNNGDMMRDAALAGLGIALLPTFIVGLFVAHPEVRHASAKLRALAECLRGAFGDPPYWEVADA